MSRIPPDLKLHLAPAPIPKGATPTTLRPRRGSHLHREHSTGLLKTGTHGIVDVKEISVWTGVQLRTLGISAYSSRVALGYRGY
jgi:hypothetical protein